MNKADILISVILLLGAVLGYRRGFLLELFLLSAILLGVFIGFRLMGAGVEYLHREFNADTSFLPYISFLIIFLIVVVFVMFAGRKMKHVVDETFLGRVDKFAGAMLGAVKYLFCASVVIWLFTSFHVGLPPDWTKESYLYPSTTRFAPRIASELSQFLPFFKEIFKQF